MRMQYHLGKMLQQAEELAVQNERQAPATTAIPWHIWACVIAVTCSGVGSVWDISWHSSIGRDTFWTAPHILIYLSGVIAGLSCGYVGSVRHLWTGPLAARRRHLIELPRTARRLPVRLGQLRHDRVSSLRQLVAQRLPDSTSRCSARRMSC